MILVLSIIFILLFWIYYRITKPLRYWSDKGVKQTKPWPIIGDMLPILLHQLSRYEFFTKLYNMYPNERYMGFYESSIPTLLITDPDLFKQITIKDFDHFVDHKIAADPNEESIWSSNLIILKGQKWREMRATLSGTFTSSKMKVIFGLMDDVANDVIKYFTDKNEDLIEIELKDCLSRYSNDVIATAAFGVKVDSLKEPKNMFYRMGKIVTNFPTISITKMLAHFFLPIKMFTTSSFKKEATDYFKEVVNDTIKTRDEKGIVRPDLINMLLEIRKGIKHEDKNIIDTGFATVSEFSNSNVHSNSTGKNLTNNQIAAQAFVFFLAGFETVSTAMSFGLYELALNKDVQDKLRKEIEETDKLVNGKITYEALLNMKYLDMVVTEVLRKWPPVTGMDRICTKPYTIEPVKPGEKPIHLKKGEILYLPYYPVHRNPEFYPNPEKFDPERFSPENKDKLVPYTFIPFGSGPRNCIGSRFALLEFKMILYKLLLKFEVVPTAKTEIPLKINRTTFNPTAENGFWVGFKPIKRN